LKVEFDNIFLKVADTFAIVRISNESSIQSLQTTTLITSLTVKPGLFVRRVEDL